MNIEQAFQKTTGLSISEGIEKAIEGGWKPHVVSKCPLYVEEVGDCGCSYNNLLDPLFWQSLGKAMGWKEKCLDCGGIVERRDTPEYPFVKAMGGVSWCPERCEAKNFRAGGIYEWFLFIHNLCE